MTLLDVAYELDYCNARSFSSSDSFCHAHCPITKSMGLVEQYLDLCGMGGCIACWNKEIHGKDAEKYRVDQFDAPCVSLDELLS